MIAFDIKKLIEDLGGVAIVAKTIGVERTQPYYWIRNGSMSLKTLAILMHHYPELDINTYTINKRGSKNGSKAAR